MRLHLIILMACLASCSDGHPTSPADSSNSNATVRLANATDAALDFRLGDSVVNGGSNLAFGRMSPCTRVSAPTPDLAVVKAGTTTNLPGFSFPLDGGSSYTAVAFPGDGSGTSFAMLLNAFRPQAGSAGFRLLNATSDTVVMDAFVTAPNGPLSQPTTKNTDPGTASALVNVPAVNRQIRVTSSGTHTVLLDAGTKSFSPGVNYTLVIAPPSPGGSSSALRAFFASGC